MGRPLSALNRNVFGSGWTGLRLGLLLRGHGRLEAADAFPQALTKFGKFLGAEDQQREPEYDNHVHRLKQSFKQLEPPVSTIDCEALNRCKPKRQTAIENIENVGAATAGWR